MPSELVPAVHRRPRHAPGHAIDERRYHPVDVYKVECGHLLMMVVQLHEQPYGRVCEACAAQTVRPPGAFLGTALLALVAYRPADGDRTPEPRQAVAVPV